MSFQIQNIQYTCQDYFQTSYPNLSPTIYSLSSYTLSYSVISSKPTKLSIHGTNFTNNGNTTVNFGQYTNLSITFYTSTNITFLIPMNAQAGNYNIQVANSTSNGIQYSNIDIFIIES